MLCMRYLHLGLLRIARVCVARGKAFVLDPGEFEQCGGASCGWLLEC